MRVIKTLFFLLVLAAIAAGAGAWYLKMNAAPATSFKTVPVTRGELLATIGATGTVEPEEVIDVGAQVNGQIIGFGRDRGGRDIGVAVQHNPATTQPITELVTDRAGNPIDYTSRVQEGDLLAKIDPTVYEADVAQNKAQVATAKAGAVRARADLGQMQAKLDQAQRDWDRAQKLGPSDALAESTYDSYKAAYETAKANLAVGQAAIAQADAAVLQSQAALDQAERRLSYCTITAPVTGVIIDRRVNIGQTVVSAMSASSMFLIAKDLTRMQLWVSVNEVDIGNIHPGQRVTFKVDARPGEVFVGEVGKIRLNATMTQNVVTYTVEVNTDNSSGKLLPYLTANVQFEVARHEDALMVPNGALRWNPTSAEQVAPDAREAFASGGRGGMRGGRSGGNGNASDSAENSEAGPSTRPAAPVAGATTRPSRGHRGGPGGSADGGGERRFGTLWVQDGEFVKPVRVRLGMTDGTDTEILSGDVQEGAQVVTGVVRADQVAGDDARNPFMPQFGRRGPGGGKGGPGGSGGQGGQGGQNGGARKGG